MRITDRGATSGWPERQRRFVVSDNSDDLLRPGALVCLHDSRGDLLAARLGARGAWALGPLVQRSRSASIPAEALFTILRRGTHIGFQCLGAEGRMVQACEQAGAGHCLAHGFGSREAWEAAGPAAAHYRFKELGARVLPVTALPTADLAQWEQESEIRVGDALSKLEAHTAAAAASERHAAELIKASQRAAGTNQRQLEDACERLEDANRAALHWQEQAALMGEALQETEAELVRLRAGGAPAPSSPAVSSEEAVDELRAQITALKLEHAGQLREMESRTAAALSRAGGGAAAVEAVRAEAAAMLATMEEAHATEVMRLLEDRARLDSALRCIKDMMCHPWGGGGNSVSAVDSDDTGVNGGEGEGLDDVSLSEAPAMGVPVDPLATPMPPSAARSGGRWAPPSASPAPADYAVFDAAGVRGKIRGMYDLVNPLGASLRPGSGGDSATNGTPSDSAQQEVYRFYPADGAMEEVAYEDSDSDDGEGGAPMSRNRVMLAGGGCAMVDYKGDRPDAVNEASMRRILDGPLGAAASGGGSDAGAQQNGPSTGHRYGRGARDSDELSYLLRQPSAAALRLGSPGAAASAPPSATKSDAVRDALAAAAAMTSPWGANSMSLSTSKNVTPVASPAPAPRPEAMAPSEAVRALNSASPVAAKFMSHYMSDQVSARASLPPGYGARAAAAQSAAAPRPTSGTPGKTVNFGSDKIPAVRRSAPTTGDSHTKRSSFLQRPLVTERDLFGGCAK